MKIHELKDIPIDEIQSKCEHKIIKPMPLGMGSFYVCEYCGLGDSSFLRDILYCREINETNTK